MYALHGSRGAATNFVNAWFAPTKDELRRAARAVRLGLGPANPHAAVQAAVHMMDSRLGASPVISLYMPVGSELDTVPIAEALLERDTRLCLPVVVSVNTPLVFRAWTPGDPLVPDLSGTPAPLSSARALDPELVLTPLLAFDAAGNRLGQGGGHFDRTIADLHARTKAVIVGLAYAGQEVPSLPLEAHDRPLDAVLTEQGFRLFTRETR